MAASATPFPVGDGAPAAVEPPGVLDALSDSIGAARTTLSGLLELLSLEARRAGLALLWMLFWGTIAAICVVTAWLGLIATVATWAMSLGISPIVVLAAVAIINLAAGLALIYLCFDLSRDLLFTATRRQIAGAAPPQAAGP